MILHRLYLRHFRNYKEALFTFEPGFNLLYGANAQGKTNVLEAIGFLATGSSFRTRHIEELISHGQKGFALMAEFSKKGLKHTLKMECTASAKQITLDNTKLSTMSELLSLLQTVILTPEDAGLIKGAPELRRRFLNIHISQSSPLYLQHLRRYHRAMKQRNTLLRSKDIRQLPIWEQEMAQSAAVLVAMRQEAIAELEAKASLYQSRLSASSDALTFSYKPSATGNAAAFIALFAKHRQRELDQGTSLYGPHKDDLCLNINAAPAKGFASEGQLWCAASSLRLSEWQRLATITQDSPLICIDEVGSHLDTTRRLQLETELLGLSQVFLTSPHEFPPGFTPTCHKICIENGQIAEQTVKTLL